MPENEGNARPFPQDDRLGRVFRRDPRNARFPIREALPTTQLQGRGWPLGPVRLNQPGPQCTGYSATYDLICQPAPLATVPAQWRDWDALAIATYEEARRQDEWPGEQYEGSSTLGAARALKVLGFHGGEYRWAGEGGSDPTEDVLLAIGHLGPVVLGTDWLDGMFDAGPGGLLDVSGSVAGGHAYLARGVILSKAGKRQRLGRGGTVRGEPLVYGPNSWSASWGKGGEWAMYADDLSRLLAGFSWPGDARVTTVPFRR